VSENSGIEERVQRLEQAVADLQGQLTTGKPRPGWLARLRGSLKEYPEFDEVARLGKELRDRERPADEP
jgi:hypothetical protein